MNEERYFLWNSETLDGTKIKALRRLGSRVFAKYGRHTRCLNHCASPAEAGLALSLLKAKVGGVDAREGQ